jgi:sugar lactone lactonase YvrE
MVAAAVIGFTVKWHAPKRLPSFKRLTFQRGHVTGARFAPDGQTVFYSAAWEGRPSELFSMNLSRPESRTLGISPARLTGVSENGVLAFLISSEFRDEVHGWFTGTLAISPVSGGAPRELKEWVVAADISRDGRSLAANIQEKTSDQFVLEYPLGTRLARGMFLHPRISPDGERVCLVEYRNNQPTIAIFDRKGSRHVLSTGWRIALSPVWAPKGNEVWFSAGEGMPQTLFAVDLRGRTRELLRAPPTILLEDVTGDGRAIVKRLDVRNGILCRPPGESGERDLSWFEDGEIVDISSDGKLLLFTERGGGTTKSAVYVRKTDGSPATRLGDGLAIALSRDARFAVSQPPDTSSTLLLLPIGPGQVHSIAIGKTEFSNVAGWSVDGTQFLYWAATPDHLKELHELTLSTGRDRRVGSMKVVVGGLLSPDGKMVIGCEAFFQRCSVFSLDGGAPVTIPGSIDFLNVIAWDSDGRSVFVTDGGVPMKVYRIRIVDGRRELWKEFRPADPAGVSYVSSCVISPTTGAYAYTYERVLSELYLVEGLN